MRWRCLQHHGAEMRDVTLPPLDEYHAAGSIILTAEAYAVHEPWLASGSTTMANCSVTASLSAG